MTLVPLPSVDALTPAMREVAVSTYLEHAKEWLASAVEMTGPEQIAAAKAEIATAAEATKQLHLSKEIQLDAQEMVRRAEYALGKAIRKGQAEGMIRTKGERGPQTADYERIRNGRHEVVQAPVSNATNFLKPGPTDFASHEELYGNKSGAMHLVDGVTDDQFESALDVAKREGNPSRANVVRKIRGEVNPASLSRQQRADLIADLAQQGYSSQQMPKRVGVVVETVRLIARDFDIDIPADRIVGKRRRIDHTHIVESTVTGLENTVSALAFIDWTEVDPSQADEWANSLTDSINELRRFLKQIKEMTHV